MKVVAKPIQVIAWFGDEGSINPVRFKLQGEEESQIIKINKVLKREKEKLAGSIMEKFLCSSCINGAEKIYEIKYDTKSYRWILFKI